MYYAFVFTKLIALHLLKRIKVDKSQGPYGIYSRLLREAREDNAGAFTNIFVSSIYTGESRGTKESLILFIV